MVLKLVIGFFMFAILLNMQFVVSKTLHISNQNEFFSLFCIFNAFIDVVTIKHFICHHYDFLKKNIPVFGDLC